MEMEAKLLFLLFLEQYNKVDMAHFSELDENNIVLRNVVACNQDIANNGGEQSDESAEHFKTVLPFSNKGVKWVQSSYNNNFRGHFSKVGDAYDKPLDLFISPKPYPSWILNTSTGYYEAPVEFPSQYIAFKNYGAWDEANQVWILDPSYEFLD